MASNNEFFVTLGLKKKGFDQGLKDAGNEVDDLGDKLGGLEKDTQKATGGLEKTGESAKEAAEGAKDLAGGMSSIPWAAVIAGVAAVFVAFSKWYNQLTDLEEQQKKLRESTAGFTASARTQTVVLQNLLNVASDETKTILDRKDALIEAQTQADGYLDYLSLETLATIGATDALSNYKDELLRNAEVKGLESALTDTFKEIALKSNISAEEATGPWEDFAQSFNAIVLGNTVGGFFNDLIDENALENNRIEIGLLEDKVNDFTGALSKLEGEKAKKPFDLFNSIMGIGRDNEDKIAAKAKEDAIAYAKSLSDQLKIEAAQRKELQLQVQLEISADNVDISDAKLAIAELGEQLRNSSGYDETISILKQQQTEELNLILAQYNKKIEAAKLLGKGEENAKSIALNEIGIAEINIRKKYGEKIANVISAQNNVVGKLTNEGFTIVKSEMELFSEEVSSIVENNLESAFAGIGEAIGSSLANGTNVFKALGDVLLSSLGKLLTQLGEAAIAVGVGMLAIQASFSNPFTAIAAGVALVAIGTAISSAKGAVNDVGGGNAQGSSTSAGGGVTTGFSSSSSPGGFEGRVVFEIAGSKLIGVLNNTSRDQFRTGTDNGLITAG